VKLFSKNIKPAEALDSKQVRRWLADLGSNEFAAREAASQALLELDHEAIPYLEAKLKSADSAEVRVRVEKILEQKRASAFTPKQLREVRAVMVLERIADGAAKELLKQWAGGPEGAILTTEASAALKRLELVSKANR
jgi:hypothetical protein